MRRLLPALAACAAVLHATAARAADPPVVTPVDSDRAASAGDLTWMLAAGALTMLMLPGLALFYGGMVRRKNVLGTMLHPLAALSIVGVLWAALGYSLAFGSSLGGWLGWAPELTGLGESARAGAVVPGTQLPVFVHALYHGLLATLAAALVGGAFAERARFGPFCVFAALWTVLVYAPVAHWFWAMDAAGQPVGWVARLGALDFAGGLVVHAAAGGAGLAAALVLRPRQGYLTRALPPNSMVLTLAGAGLLWCGWLGANGAGALTAGPRAGSALVATHLAAAAGGLSWAAAEWLYRGKPTGLGWASGAVAGLVAITAGAGFVGPRAALVVGLLAGPVCYAAVCLKPRIGYDDTLDVFGVHGIGGALGAVLTGVLAAPLFGAQELPAGGRLAQVGVQWAAVAAVLLYAFGVTAVLIKGIDLAVGFCVSPRVEDAGLDLGIHGEAGFDQEAVEEEMVAPAFAEPRSALAPPEKARRFTVVVEGASDDDLIAAWSALCQGGEGPAAPEFRAAYPFVTTVQGNRFRCRGGDAPLVRESLQRLFQDRLEGVAIRTYVES